VLLSTSADVQCSETLTRYFSAEFNLRQQAPEPAAPQLASAVNRDVFEKLWPQRARCKKAVDIWTSGRLVKVSVLSSGGIAVQQNEREWLQMDYDNKIRRALNLYCAYTPQDGDLTVIIYGMTSGKQLGSVVNGNW
jgi:hypothetical protein